MKEAVEWKQRSGQSSVVHYFFNARSSNELEKSSMGLYRSLAHQILTTLPDGLDLVTEMFLSKERGGKMVEEWHTTGLCNFFSLEFVTDDRVPALTLFIDGLDEGEEDDVCNMIDSLIDIVHKSWSAKNIVTVCLSSRHYPNITIHKSISIVLEEQHEHQNDIELYVLRKLKENS